MKIFGIGLSKTGTTSLARSLEILGYSVKDFIGVTHYKANSLSSIDLNIINENDAFTDTPIPSFYKSLDTEYPGSKFILTIRDIDGWLKSCKKQFTQKSADKRSDAGNQLFLDLYGTVVFDEEKFRNSYQTFTDNVIEYFKDRPSDLLLINISNNEGWEKLCPFLNKPLQKTLFPKSNVTQLQWLNAQHLAKSIRHQALKLPKPDHIENSLLSTLYSLFGQNREKRLNNSRLKVENSIINTLQVLSNGIPIISHKNHDYSVENRHKWHHFWLIDISTISNKRADPHLSFIVNIALIEDGKPYIGIIYNTENDILYFSHSNQSAYKAVGDEDPISIPKIAPPLEEMVNQSSSEKSIAWHLSYLIETPCNINLPASKEWQTAAGQALLNSVGISLVENTSKQVLKYNKADWNNPNISVTLKTS